MTDAEARVIRPGEAVGVLGGGQLGRMFAIAARRMGYRVHTLCPEDDTPTGQVADVEVKAGYDDLEAVGRFARGVSVVTFEFENVSAAAAAEAARHAPVRPAGSVLHVTQHRLREKTFLRERGFPVTPFAAVDLRGAGGETVSDTVSLLQLAIDGIGLPGILKTAGFGYDGKGQRRVSTASEAAAAAAAFAGQEAVLEKAVDFEAECSVVAARGVDGSYADFGLIRNDHANHILDVSVSPSGFDPKLEAEARAIARSVLEALEVVGVLCVEFFVTKDGRLLINELAPRPHNSGHLTFDACVTSQFEQQLRAICGLPLGDTALLRPAAMANLLGEAWSDGEPDWPAALAHPGVKLHLYGKRDPRPGRKMGHLTAMADSAADAARVVRAARAALGGGG